MAKDADLGKINQYVHDAYKEMRKTGLSPVESFEALQSSVKANFGKDLTLRTIEHFAYETIEDRRRYRQNYRATEKYKKAKKRYAETEKFKLTQKRYRTSEKGIETRRRHSKSEKFTQTQGRYRTTKKYRDSVRRSKRKTTKPVNSKLEMLDIFNFEERLTARQVWEKRGGSLYDVSKILKKYKDKGLLFKEGDSFDSPYFLARGIRFLDEGHKY